MKKLLTLLLALTLCLTAFSAVPAFAESTAPIKIKQVSVAHTSSLATRTSAVTEDGDLYVWGSIFLKAGGYTPYLPPKYPVKAMEGVKSIAEYAENSAVITENGDLYTWGMNKNGEIGDGTTDYSYTPIKILSGVKSVVLAAEFCAAVTEKGELYMWGDNYSGQLGDGTTEDRLAPVKIMENVKEVCLNGEAATNLSAAVTEDGELYMWGDGTTEPVKIMEDVKSFTTSDSHHAAITENGDLYTWGYNGFGELGDGTTESRSEPINVMSKVKSVSLSDNGTAAVTEKGELYIWGSNMSGELGDGTFDEVYGTAHPIPKKVMENVKSVRLGSTTSAIAGDGKLYMWGDNNSGRLGDGTTDARYTPFKTMEGVGSVQVDLICAAAVTEDGKLYMWGDNYSGQLGDYTTDSRYTPDEVIFEDDSEEDDFILGDIDGSGEIDVNDLSSLKALIMSHKADEEWEADTLATGDIDESGDIDVNDLSALKSLIMTQA